MLHNFTEGQPSALSDGLFRHVLICSRYNSSHAHNDEYFRGWAFLNHISLLYYYGLIIAINVHHLSEKLTPKEAILMTKDICRITDPNGTQHLTHIRKETQEILDTLGVVLSAT